jgi:flagellar hook protein FlgE
MPFNTALSGLQAASSDLRVIANNVANTSTTGFKQSRAQFADVYANSSGAANSSIGSGVILSSVEQQFSQGQVEFTNNNLDMAVSGEGFFILSENGNISYSRAGAFGVDRDGFIVNNQGQTLRGFSADSLGNITGAQGDMQISNANLSPNATSDVDITVNLDATATPPSTAFVPGFTSAAPPNPSSYNTSTSTTVFDSLGNSHILTSYFIKAPQANTWRVYTGIDGTDVTPTAAPPPAGAPPVAYGAGQVAFPYTVVFEPTGGYVVNNPSAPPLYYGAGPINSTATGIVNSGTLPTLNLNDLLVNGVPIDPPSTSSDIFSTSDGTASAKAIVSSINSKTQLHGVTASVNANTFDLGIPAIGNIDPGDFSINGISINGAVANDAALLNLINLQTPNTGVTATQPGGAGTAITLTAADGRNIQLQTDGVQANGASFANFNLNGGVLNQVQRSTFSVSTNNNQGINIGGANPGNVGLSLGPLAGIIQTNSDLISISNWTPSGGAQGPQLVNIDFSSSTQFGAPFSVQALSQDGYSTGRLSGVNVDVSGTIFARYSNGQSLALGQVALANFGNTQGLSPVGDTGWVETFDSGPALIGAPGTADLGAVQSSALEDSNVQLTEQLVALIVAQRNFQANAQTIRTADAVTQTIINLR